MERVLQCVCVCGKGGGGGGYEFGVSFKYVQIQGSNRFTNLLFSACSEPDVADAVTKEVHPRQLWISLSVR